MKPNINIDRISLEERIKKLEDRSPVVAPGGSSNQFIDPNIINNCTPNQVTDVGSGLILYISLDNLETMRPITGTVPWSVNIKIAVYFPRLAGAVSFPTMYMCRIHSPKVQTIQQLMWADIDIDWDPIYSTFASIYVQSQIPTNLGLELFPRHSNCPIAFLTPNSTTDVVAFSPSTNVQTYIRLSRERRYAKNQSLYIEGGGASNGMQTITIGQGYSFGYYRTYPGFLAGIPSGHTSIGGGPNKGRGEFAFSVVNPQDLPDKIKPVYPTSWYS